jgi:hypothetical protein
MRFLYSLYFVVCAFSVFAQMDSLRIEGRKPHPNRIITLCLNSEQNRANLSLSLDYMVSTSSPIGEKKAFQSSLMKNRIEGGFSYGFTLGWMF